MFRRFLTPALAALLVCTLAAVAAPKDKGVVFTSKAGKFTITFPEKPKETTKKVATAAGNLDNHLFYVEKGANSVYLLSYSDYPKGSVTANNKDKILDGCRDGVTNNLRGKRLSEKKLTVGADKHPGRDILVELPNKNLYRTRLYLVGERLFQIVVLGPSEFVKDKQVDSFLDSFKLDK